MNQRYTLPLGQQYISLRCAKTVCSKSFKLLNSSFPHKLQTLSERFLKKQTEMCLWAVCPGELGVQWTLHDPVSEMKERSLGTDCTHEMC